MHDHAHGHGHGGGEDARRLSIALALILVFMAGEVVAGILGHSLALLSDAAHMLTDAGALVMSLVVLRLAAQPARGNRTFGLRRSEILSAQANGAALLVLACLIVYGAVRRLVTPPPTDGGVVLVVALVGIGVNLAATWQLAGANRESLNIEGSYQHVLNDLFAFIATAIAGAVILGTGWVRADAVAALLVAGLMLRASWRLLRDSGRVLLDIAPAGLPVQEIGTAMASHPGGRGGARPPRLGGHDRVPDALGARARRAGSRLPRHPARARGAPARTLRPRAHDPPGRARAREARPDPLEEPAWRRLHGG